jgi:hypothetical protein
MHNAVDQEWEIIRDGDVRYINFGGKQRDAADDNAVTFRLEVVALGKDSDGDQVTTCVIEVLNNSAPLPPRKARKLPAAQQAVIDTFCKLDKIGSVTYAKLREECGKLGVVSNTEKSKDRFDAFGRAFRNLPNHCKIYEHSDDNLHLMPELETE